MGLRRVGCINPGAVGDRQIVLNDSVPRGRSDNGESSIVEDVFSPEEHALFETRYKEGYNIPDTNYLMWLRIHHPDSACSVGGSS